jgi:protein-disulfide isomerase
MSKNGSKIMAAALAVGIAAGLVYGYRYLQDARAGESSLRAADALTKGDPAAPIQVVEFIDFQCPACAAGALVIKNFMRDNPGTVFLQMKYFPLAGHPHGIISAKYAECAARQGQFWAMHDLILENQPQWRDLTDARPALDMYARNLGLDLRRLGTCLASPETAARLVKTKAEGEALGVRSTPSYVINGELIVGFRNLTSRLNQLRDKFQEVKRP